MRFTVTKHSANRWEVRGTLCTDYQRWRLENYQRVFTNKKAAQADADRWERLLVNAFEEHMAYQQWRLRNVRSYLATRKERPSATQLKLF